MSFRAGADQFMAGIPSDYLPVTPHDTNPLTGRVIGLYVEVAGNIVVKMQGGTNRTLAIANNEFIYGLFTHVLSTDTTATGIHAMVVPG